MKTTPVIYKLGIESQEYLGPLELDNFGGYYEIVRIKVARGSYLLAGSACNTGFIPEYARPWDPAEESLDSALAELMEDLSAVETDGPEYAGELLSWHGSLVI